MKKCTRCGETKPLEEFFVKRAGAMGRTARCKPCTMVYCRSDAGRRVKRRAALKLRYGISDEQYRQILHTQGGKCALCGSGDPKARWGMFQVDHCHETGRVRGLLCFLCNTAIGRLGDRVESLARVVEYLQPK